MYVIKITIYENGSEVDTVVCKTEDMALTIILMQLRKRKPFKVEFGD